MSRARRACALIAIAAALWALLAQTAAFAADEEADPSAQEMVISMRT